MKTLIRAAFVFFLCTVGTQLALGQSVGSLQGQVLDSSGAAVAKASVVATDTATNTSETAETDNTGSFVFTQLHPGTYRVQVTKTGFQSVAQENVSVLVATPTRLDFKLKVGEVSEVVDVTSSAVPVLNTEDATIGNTFDETEVKSLPFLARNVVNLLTIQPGVVFTGRSDTDRLSMGDTSVLDPREGVVDGIRGNQTNLMVDGIDANDWFTQAAFTSALPITLDSVQEFRVTTTGANATSGLVSGAQVQLVTKNEIDKTNL